MDNMAHGPQSTKISPPMAALLSQCAITGNPPKAAHVYLGGEKISHLYVSLDAVETLKLLYPDCTIVY